MAIEGHQLKCSHQPKVSSIGQNSEEITYTVHLYTYTYTYIYEYISIYIYIYTYTYTYTYTYSIPIPVPVRIRIYIDVCTVGAIPLACAMGLARTLSKAVIKYL